MTVYQWKRGTGLATLLLLAGWSGVWNPATSAPNNQVTVHWDQVTRVSKTIPTLQVVVNPPLRRGSAIHDRAFRALRELEADYVRYVPWLPYPKLAVAELDPPHDG